MAMTELEQHYNKFNEEKRLDSRHGRVEFITSITALMILRRLWILPVI